MIFVAWYDHLEKIFSYREVQFRKFCLLVKTNCPVSESINETSDVNTLIWDFRLSAGLEKKFESQLSL